MQAIPNILSIVAGLGGLGMGNILTKWWAHRDSTRKQSDTVALDLVERLQTRVGELELLIGNLHHELKNAVTEADGLLWLLKYAPDARRAEAVADVERVRRERAEQKANVRQAAQIAVSAQRVFEKGEPA